jgi:hypothetical protein
MATALDTKLRLDKVGSDVAAQTRASTDDATLQEMRAALLFDVARASTGDAMEAAMRAALGSDAST